MPRSVRITPWLLLGLFAASGLLFGATWVLALAPVVALLVPLLAGRYVGETVLARWARRFAASRPRPRGHLRPPRQLAARSASFLAATASRAPPVLA